MRVFSFLSNGSPFYRGFSLSLLSVGRATRVVVVVIIILIFVVIIVITAVVVAVMKIPRELKIGRYCWNWEGW